MRTSGIVLLVVLLVLISGERVSAQSEVGTAMERRVKIGASSLLGLPSVGVERALRRDGRTFQWDVTLSPWASVEGYPFQFMLAIAEWRRYRTEAGVGGYWALNTGAGLFRLRRPDYRDTTLYQEGGTLVAGASVGYVWRLRSGRTIDAFVGGGTMQSLYKGYDKLTGRRYDGAKLWNISAEILPFRSGLSIGLPRAVR